LTLYLLSVFRITSAASAIIPQNENSFGCGWKPRYDITEVHALYDKYHITSVRSSSGMKAKKNGTERVINREVLITNFQPPQSPLFLAQDMQQLLLEKQADYQVPDNQSE